MKSWIVYKKEDAEKNIAFISRLVAELAKYDIEAKLVFLGREPKNETPSFVINRSRDFEVAQRLERKGVRVFNESRLVKIANNKKKTFEFFDGVVDQMPLTKDYPCVMKSLDGHGGSEVFLIEKMEDEDQARIAMHNKPYIRQEVCSDLGKDKRVYIVGGNVVGAVLRSADNFKSNYSLGGKAKATTLDEKELNIVEKITKKIYIDYAGIDIIYNNGEPVFNEIEDPVGARMLYENTDIDIVEIFVDYLVKEMTEIR